MRKEQIRFFMRSVLMGLSKLNLFFKTIYLLTNAKRNFTLLYCEFNHFRLISHKFTVTLKCLGLFNLTTHMTMTTHTLNRLKILCDQIPPLLLGINEADFSKRPAPEKWNKQEILGHLLDSATNNHQRFVRAQFEEEPLIVYDQNKWNQFSYYSSLNKNDLIYFWQYYNKHLCALFKSLPKEKLNYKCRVDENKLLSLELLFEDYVKHLEHHLKQIVNYN